VRLDPLLQANHREACPAIAARNDADCYGNLHKLSRTVRVRPYGFDALAVNLMRGSHPVPSRKGNTREAIEPGPRCSWLLSKSVITGGLMPKAPLLRVIEEKSLTTAPSLIVVIVMAVLESWQLWENVAWD
jgi:hypothetical protein